MPILDQRRCDLLVVDEAFSYDELLALSNAAAALSFEPQGAGHVLARRERAVTEDDEIADLIWSRISPLLPPIAEWFDGHAASRLEPPISQWVAVGCNPRTRFYRYGMGAGFSQHEDEPWKPDANTRSMLTVLVYLPAGGCEGGETVIDGEAVPVVDGRVVVFDHRLLHEGKPVERGRKLVLRNDVVAKPIGASRPSSR